MVGIADQVILLADASKFGLRAFARVTGLDEVHTIITDQPLTEEQISLCSNYQLLIRTV
ncbi:DNA-binding transcriptional repressor SrlR [compost metagenome]